MTEPIHPPALSPGDEVAIVAPSRTAREELVERGVRRLESTFDLRPRVFETVRRDNDYLADHPEERAADVVRAFEDPDVRAVFAIGGGDDELRILPELDRDALESNPTRFFGYSDNTNLSLYLWNLGVVSYAGGQVMPALCVDPSIHDYTEEFLRRALFDDRLGELRPATEWTDTHYDFESGEPREWYDNDGWRWHGAGRTVDGRVWGGCYEIVDFHLRTERYLPDAGDLDGAVLALELSEELPHPRRVRRSLMCMGERGLLAQFDAVLFGRVRRQSGSDEPRPLEGEEYRSRVHEVVTRQLDRYNPEAVAVFGLDFGHSDPHVPLPIGANVTIDCETETISFR